MSSDIFDFESACPSTHRLPPSGVLSQADCLPSKWQEQFTTEPTRVSPPGRVHGLGIVANGHTPAEDLWEGDIAHPDSASDPAAWRTELNRPLAERAEHRAPSLRLNSSHVWVKHSAMELRPATPRDLELLRRWDEQPHIVASDPNDDWAWEIELSRSPDWREQLIAEVAGHPIGFIQIIDPAREESHYWGDVPADLRAIDAPIASMSGWVFSSLNTAVSVKTNASFIAWIGPITSSRRFNKLTPCRRAEPAHEDPPRRCREPRGIIFPG